MAYGRLQFRDGLRVVHIVLQAGCSRMVWEIQLQVSAGGLLGLGGCNRNDEIRLSVLPEQVHRVHRHVLLLLEKEVRPCEHSARDPPRHYADVRLVSHRF